jgi:3-oxoacyl-[acyl-carrier-protein] synthase III
MRSRIESIGVSMPGGRLLKKGSVDHAVAAGKRCLGISRYGTGDVQTLINAGMFRDGHCGEPAMAAFIQEKLGINAGFGGNASFSFDLVNGGVGMLSAIQVADALMKSGAIRVGMAVASDANTDARPDPAYDYPRSGAAVILDRSPDSHRGFGSFVFRTFEEHGDASAARVELFTKGGRLRIEKSDRLDDIYLGCAVPVFEELLEREGLAAADIDLVVPSQISPRFLGSLPGALGVATDRVVNVMDETGGDTHTTSLIIALEAAIRRGLAPRGTKAALLAVGSGVTVGCALYNF